ncbi:hypothetical protein Tco_0410783 [Tanacetum coccineum]
MDMDRGTRKDHSALTHCKPVFGTVLQKRMALFSRKKQAVTNEMAREDEEKTAFYTEQGTYCYMKMPFGLKNMGATYQRLVDPTFQSQKGRNLEAYVDDMVVWCRRGQIFGIHGHIRRNQGKPQKDKGHIGSHFPENIEGNAKSQWKASFFKSFPRQVSRKGSLFLQHP